MSKESSLDYIINHVFLPSKLPQCEDYQVTMSNGLLLEFLDALEAYQDHLPPEERALWKPCVKMIQTMYELHDSSVALDAKTLSSKLAAMAYGDSLVFHIRAQNAGLIFRKTDSQTHTTIESFELAPTTSAVMGCKSRLRRSFPGPAIRIANGFLADAAFREPLAEMLAKLDAETPALATPKAKKAPSKVAEIRDSVDPMMVTDLLTGVLRAVGDPTDVVRIHKNTRDDVVWKKALKPWRRSALWLLLRVAIQSTLARVNVASVSRLYYKSFMVFFLSRVLERAVNASLPSDLLFTMKAKIGRRVLKLDQAPGVETIEPLESTKQLLSSRWDNLQKDTDPNGIWKAWAKSRSDLSFQEDTKLKLSSLGPYLKKIAARAVHSPTELNFEPHCPLRIYQSSSIFPSINQLLSMGSAIKHTSLLDMEAWVEKHLSQWLEENIRLADTTSRLAELLVTYFNTASSFYEGNPVQISTMFLTVMELWVAVDKSAIMQHSILADYSPRFPLTFLDPLLLPRKDQMKRLSVVEQYLSQRDKPVSFLSTGLDSLAIRFYKNSASHKQRRQNIEAQAEQKREEKRRELERLMEEYRNLSTKFAESYHKNTYAWSKRTRRYRYQHVERSCSKCALKLQIDNMTIDIHEWPLPSDNLQAMLVVFELDVPAAILKWRDATYRLHIGLLSRPAKHDQHRLYYLRDYADLPHDASDISGRLQLASFKKSYRTAHYRTVHISGINVDNVLVNHGMEYDMYDSEICELARTSIGSCNVRARCTFDLLDGSYSQLKDVVADTIHYPNDIIARQSQCPPAITVHEFCAFGTLRAGHRIQWLNIARELTNRVLCFSHYDVCVLFLQACWQAGPADANTVLRESHSVLNEEPVGLGLLSALSEALSSIEGNWQSSIAVRLFTVLTSRILSLCTHRDVRVRCLCLLKQARNAALLWTRELRQKFQASSIEDERKDLSKRALEAALICHLTFNVDAAFVPDLLATHEDFSDLVESAIVVYDHCPAVASDLPVSIRHLLEESARLCHQLEHRVRWFILKDSFGLDSALSRIWRDYRPSGKWVALEKPNERWLTTRTLCESAQKSVTVHFNVLTGELLVMGKPLTRLPSQFESHATFQRLFGQKILDVVPSNMVGMDFGVREQVHGYQIHFAMHNSELIIRAMRESELLELVPTHALRGDFPVAFIDDFSHWLHVDTGTVEWRPISNPWTAESQPWQLLTETPEVRWLIRGSAILIDSASKTGHAISSLLAPLEQETHIHVTLNKQAERLDIYLPRLNLDFLLDPNKPSLESKQFRGMEVDPDQSLGTLTGLKNRLVLRNTNGSSRCVIIPFGKAEFSLEGYHVNVKIDTGVERQVAYYIYYTDCALRRLSDNNSLKSKLFKCYLHALTAHCLPDRLTGRTGTEESLDGLQNASIRSFSQLSEDHLELLYLIAELTPRRSFYPAGMRVMQTVEWSNLPPLSQHNYFYIIVRKILQHYAAFDLFREQASPLLEDRIRLDSQLLERAVIRDAVYRLDGFGAEAYTPIHDVEYNARDRCSSNLGELRSYTAARLAFGWSVELHAGFDLWSFITSWGRQIAGTRSGSAVGILSTINALGYDPRWLDDGATFLPEMWCSLQSRLSSAVESKDKYRIMFFLSTLMFSDSDNEGLVKSLLAFATVPALRQLRPPAHASFSLANGHEPHRDKIIEIVESFPRPFDECPESRLQQLDHETAWQANNRRRDLHNEVFRAHVEKFTSVVLPQWTVPFGESVKLVLQPHDNNSWYIRTTDAIRDVHSWFREWARNAEFRRYISQAQDNMNTLSTATGIFSSFSFSEPTYHASTKTGFIKYDDLFFTAPPILELKKDTSFRGWMRKKTKDQDDYRNIKALIDRLYSRSTDRFQQQYARDLERSLNSLCDSTSTELHGSMDDLGAAFDVHLKLCEQALDKIYESICLSMKSGNATVARIALLTDMWPRLSRMSLLQHLSSTKIANLSAEWRTCLIQYGAAITDLQRAHRLIVAFTNRSGDPMDLLKELSNPGHEAWNVNKYPDWLLLELESNLLIRPVQARIAEFMIQPLSGSNSVIQLNMGEGKSSVIVPIIAAILANMEKLTRIVVLKPLTPQMLQTLIAKCGGLLNRPIYYMPFSRSIRIDSTRAIRIRSLYQQCMHVGGILLTQPEHLLSFELMGYESILSDQPAAGYEMVKTQRWLNSHARDVLDESDEVLSVRFELIYTIGTQRPIEFSSDRWSLVQHVLSRLSNLVGDVLVAFPKGIEVQVNPKCGSFPHIRILQPDAGKMLMESLAIEICSKGLPAARFRVRHLSQHLRDQLYRVITEIDVPGSEVESFIKLRDDQTIDESMWKSVLLLRGLIAGGVLNFAFQEKRWRVNYGLDPSRSQLAVPFRAKDIPSARAEYSHPDSTIVLTCLCYYYRGLSDQELRVAFDTLFRSDNAQVEYEIWIQNVEGLPVAFQRLEGVNLQDTAQCNHDIFPHLRFAKGAIDFFLSHLVFPAEMREFPEKLSSSGWNIAHVKAHPTTGFSGTNDSRYILPLSIYQSDLPEQLHTNATVLHYLLGEENSYKQITQASRNVAVNTEILLDMIVGLTPPVRVLLDVGAQVLDLRNDEVAHRWLQLAPASEVQAVVFFNDDDVPCVLDRNGTLELLTISPFSRQMDQCLVYLDESHTRGTDLKMPPNYRAAVTLGPGLTKDRFVQACMRMRNLGNGQSVIACASMEIQSQILACCNKSSMDAITMADVLEWCIHQTCAQTKKAIPLWGQQGLRYQKQQVALSKAPTNPEAPLPLQIAELLLEPKAQSLEARYGWKSPQGSLYSIISNPVRDDLMARAEQVSAIISRCHEFRIHSLNSATLQEEQERELSPENEREHEVERPRPMTPCQHHTHQFIKSFVETGRLCGLGVAFQPAFASLRSTSAAEHTGFEEWPTDLLATMDFVNTVQAPRGQAVDFYLKPVNWILSHQTKGGVTTYLVISPTEANDLLPMILQHKVVTLHVYSPRIRLSMRSLEDLSFCAIPRFTPPLVFPRAITHLNLFAGQLYLRDYEEYLSLCAFLGLCYQSTAAKGDGFIIPRDRDCVEAVAVRGCRFTVSPIGFLRKLMTIRRKGQSFERSHLGIVLQGYPLDRDQVQLGSPISASNW
ncbi:hypothetical protein K432DRAFT_424453 [Lepidopterella palustris CBS 459.81]|uniref:ubiquitinyl hydrolase 1 n=1 Tax=Lepidopterella palustris CBS 459.81 TaxID=1314670 RepID=A0A8E2JGX1_9PEZI|nr:hypothetical protein K432DRAFT_424453 [Lepidopterella palustris CBS 459.81]